MVLGQIISTAFWVMKILILVRVIVSYFPHNPNNAVFKFIYEVTEPILAPLRKVIPIPKSLPIDFTPIVAFILLSIAEQIVWSLFL
ncbi:YggT family protein [Heliorestis acidaminivorans]|nr:YggT family protein [Heliorestis acidaminivorans]